MGTPFSTIYEAAVFKFTDYDFLKLNIPDRDAVLKKYLYSTLAEFSPVCDIDLTDIDEVNNTFNKILDNRIIEILASGIAFFWVENKTMNIELLRNELSTKDWSYFSPANLAREATALKESYRKAYRRKITLYSYYQADISSLQP